MDEGKQRDRRDKIEVGFDYDGFDRLSEAVQRREKLRNQEAAIKHRTWSGYERNVKQIGKKDEIDKIWDKKLFEHREEIRRFYAEHPELGNAPHD